MDLVRYGSLGLQLTRNAMAHSVPTRAAYPIAFLVDTAGLRERERE